MFDAKSILDSLVKGGQPQAQQQGSELGALSNLLHQFTGAQAPAGPGAAAAAAAPSPAGGGLEDLLRKAMAQGAGGGASGGLGDILGKLQQQLGQGGGGNIMDVLGQVLGTATSGVREGAGRIDDATGASRYARDAIGEASGGRTPEELVAQLKDLIAKNPGTATAALGGLSALVLGTGAGRSLAGSAVKLGGLALVGGLAYKAYQNYQQGLPPLGRGGKAAPAPQALRAAPNGSGFEAGAVTHDRAKLLIRAMIAAAAADGRIDAGEQSKIIGNMQQAGIDDASHQFLKQEISHPATAEELAQAVSSPEEAVQVYTAARLAIDANNAEEHEFLTKLAGALGIDANLAAQVEASLRSTA